MRVRIVIFCLRVIVIDSCMWYLREIGSYSAGLPVPNLGFNHKHRDCSFSNYKCVMSFRARYNTTKNCNRFVKHLQKLYVVRYIFRPLELSLRSVPVHFARTYEWIVWNFIVTRFHSRKYSLLKRMEADLHCRLHSSCSWCNLKLLGVVLFIMRDHCADLSMRSRYAWW